MTLQELIDKHKIKPEQLELVHLILAAPPEFLKKLKDAIKQIKRHEQ